MASSECTFVPKSCNGDPESLQQRLHELDDENPRLKRLYAELALENNALKDVIAKKL